MATLDKNLLDILVCPVSGSAVELLPGEQLDALNEQIRSGAARYTDGTAVDGPLQAALVTVDGATVYPVNDGIPVMLPTRGIDAPA